MKIKNIDSIPSRIDTIHHFLNHMQGQKGTRFNIIPDNNFASFTFEKVDDKSNKIAKISRYGEVVYLFREGNRLIISNDKDGKKRTVDIENYFISCKSATYGYEVFINGLLNAGMELLNIKYSDWGM